MSCSRPIAPHLKDRIKEVEWEDLDPDKCLLYFALLLLLAHTRPASEEDIMERDLKNIRAWIADKVWVFRRAKLSLV